MGIFNKLKGFLKKIFKIENTQLEAFEEKETIKELPIPEISERIELPEGELVSLSDEVLDTTSKATIEKFKHNLNILMKKAKEEGKVDKFMLIREDDFFPTDGEWRVLSKNTNIEKRNINISNEIRRVYALEQKGIKPYNEGILNGIEFEIPISPDEKEIEKQALADVDKTIGSIVVPSPFRSTKHFTINTPLEVTGDYNQVSQERDYVIMDDISNFLSSGYAYSISSHDAYLDISHEALPISEEAIVLINDENYERIMSDEKVAKELTQRRVVRFKGEYRTAIWMILTENGVLPSQVGTDFANYDEEKVRGIVDKSIENLAKEHDLFFDKSHGGELGPDGGHFSNYYDDKNEDYEKGPDDFFMFLSQKFPGQEALILQRNARKIVKELGTDRLLKVIDEYNELATTKAEETLEAYKQDRESITPKIHQQFVETIALINDFYKRETNYSSNEERLQTEKAIQKFIQGETVAEQLEAAKTVWTLLPHKKMEETSTGNETITMKQIVSNAIRNGISAEHIEKCDSVEFRKLREEQQREGETISGE